MDANVSQDNLVRIGQEVFDRIASDPVKLNAARQDIASKRNRRRCDMGR